MKKPSKKIYPTSILRILWLTILLLFFIATPIAAIICLFITKELYIIVLILGIILGCVGIIEFFLEIRKSINFDEEKIYVLSDKTLIFRKIQYEVAVEFKEIVDIKLVATNCNSKNQSMYGVVVKMPYVVLVCKDGSEKMINLYYYSKKQSARIINEIRNRVGSQGGKIEISSGETMIANFLETHR